MGRVREKPSEALPTFAAPRRGRLGWLSGPTTRVCLQWLDVGMERRRRKPHGNEGITLPGRQSEVRQTPQVERRKAHDAFRPAAFWVLMPRAGIRIRTNRRRQHKAAKVETCTKARP